MAEIRSLLLLPRHVAATPETLPLLGEIQTLLNVSYAPTYRTIPRIFGSDGVRLSDPAQLADTVGSDGFTIVLVAISDSADGPTAEAVATATAKRFDGKALEFYEKWSTTVIKTTWLDREANAAGDQRGDSPFIRARDEADDDGGDRAPCDYELAAFGVSPNHQRLGLGGRTLNELEWLATAERGMPRIIRIQEECTDTCITLKFRGTSDMLPVRAIDLDHAKQIVAADEAAIANQMLSQNTDLAASKMVLLSIRDLGNEAYYGKRGYRSIWSGTLPIGMWGCKQECTLVYQEKHLN